MPFDRERGELLQALGPGHRVADTRKWLDTTLFAGACLRAEEAFHQAGALLPVRVAFDDILIQEYPLSRKVAFIFGRPIAGKAFYHVDVVDLTPGMIAQLVMAGRWDDPKIN